MVIVRRFRTVALAAVVLSAAVTGPAASQPPAIGHTDVFARVPDPGMPEGIAVRDGVVLVSTHNSVSGNANQGPSKIFAYAAGSGERIGELTIQGQKLDRTHGVLALTFDAGRHLYAVDQNPGRVLRIDVPHGVLNAVQTTYATIAELPSCPPGGAPPTAQPCSPTLVDMPTWANYVVFDRSGYGYVSDLQSATIWRVPPGGGTARVWFQDARLDSYFGPNGLAIDPSGTKLYVAMTASFQPTSPGLGIIYTLPLVSSPRAADLHTFFTYPEPGAGPDGLAFGASRKLYVALAGTNQISVLDSNGTEALRFPDAAANAMQEIPYDAPASIAFDGAGSILVTNHSFFTADRNHWAVLRAYVNDTELPGR